ncbi:hypothetical protein AURDEDRAFT_188276 [Auricularia subglabra TFB-10046 SS5]|nr:hypothetical protein AURDEDRAFT_188276 [Auricularia subglabra TFB-10046 SS5]
MVASLVVLAFASLALGHVRINYPLGEWEHTEEQQETGAFCAGGKRGAASAWGVKNGFISVSGDSGDKFSIKWQSSGSKSEAAKVENADSFKETLLTSATFPESGNFCFDVTLPGAAEAEAGTQGTLYVEVDGEEGKLSSCADVAIVPDLDAGETTAKSSDGKDVLNPDSGEPASIREYYCSNSTILAFACACHCHGASEHCHGDCSAADTAEAKAQCEASASGSGTGTGTGDEPAPTETGGNGASSVSARWGAALVASLFAATSML